MKETVTLELPEQVASSARRVALVTHRRVEDVLVDWLGRSAQELPVDFLSDDEVLELANRQMEPSLQQELSYLLNRNREGHLAEREGIRLDELMQIYRHGMVRKAESIKVAVDRGLIPPLN